MKGKMQRIIAMILVCCLMLSVDSFVAMAEEEGKVSFDTGVERERELSEEWANSIDHKEVSWVDESTSAEDVSLRKETSAVDEGSLHHFDETKRITENDVPVSIGYEEAKERGHRERRYDLEGNNPYKVVFDNDDDTRTEYYFDYPVKYTDKQGKVHDVKMELTRCNEGYRTAENSIVTTFSDKLEKGVILTDEEVNIRLVPEFVESSDAQIDTAGKTVTYAIDDVTKIEYSLTYLGFKEDIVVSEYNGVTEYDFLLYTGGLKLQRIQEEWFLVDEAGVVHATVGDLIIFTADEKNNTLGEIYVETITRGELYRMTLVIDDEYLRSPDTKYPIRIDPTIEVNYENDGAGAIEDVTINSGMGSLGTSGSIFIGKRTSGGIARTLMRFPGLDMSGIRSASQIQSATVEIRDLMCESTAMVVNCHVFTGNTWTEGTATWSNTSPNSYQSTVLSSNTVSYANGKKQATVHRYSFDITDAVIGWKLGNYNINKGILFKASSSTESSSSQLYKTFASYNRASYKPSLSITYKIVGPMYEGTYYLNNEESGRYLGNSGSSAYQYRGLLSNLGSKVQWAVHGIGDYYVIQPSTNSSLYLCSTGTSSTTVSLRSITDGIIPTNCRWDIEYAGQYKTYLKNVGTGRYLADDNGIKAVNASSKDVWRTVTTSYYGSGSSYARRELTSTDAIFNNLVMDIDGSADITTNSNATKILWASPSDFTYTVSDDIATVSGTVVSCTYGTVIVTATHKVTGLKKTFTARTYKSAIVVVPGILASELKKADGSDLWTTEQVKDIGKIALSAIHVAKNPLEKYQVITEGTTGIDETYAGLLSTLDNQYSDKYDIIYFPYDWTKSNTDAAIRLRDEVASEYERITVIAHSMGGLVASYYLVVDSKAQEKVRQMIFVGCPLAGAPALVQMWESGDFSEFAGMDLPGAVQNLFGDLPMVTELFLQVVQLALENSLAATDVFGRIVGDLFSVYELLPTEWSGVYRGNTTEANMSTYHDSEKANWVRDLYGFSETKSNLADLFHNPLYVNGKHISTTVNSHYIAGVGKKTVNDYVYNVSKGKWTCEYTSNGDSVVPLWSATLGNRYLNNTTVIKYTHIGLVKYGFGDIVSVIE